MVYTFEGEFVSNTVVFSVYDETKSILYQRISGTVAAVGPGRCGVYRAQGSGSAFTDYDNFEVRVDA